MNEASHAQSLPRRARATTARAIPASPSTSRGSSPSASTPAPSSGARRALTARRSVKKEYQAAWLVRALTCLDLTTLAGDDTPGRVHRLCAKARRPLDEDILAALGLQRLAADRRRGLRLSHDGRARRQGARRLRHPGRLGRHRLSRRPDAAQAAPRRNRLRVERGGRRDRHRHHPRPCPQPRMDARSTTRSRRCARPAARRISRRSSPPAT